MDIIKAEVNGNTYLVRAGSIQINSRGEETVTLDDVSILENGRHTSEFGENFSGHKFTPEEVASEIIRHYINGIPQVNVKEVYIQEIVDAKNKYAENAIEISGVKRNLKYLGIYGNLELTMIEKDGFTYYSDGDEYICLRTDGSIATSHEFFTKTPFLKQWKKAGMHILQVE